MLTNICITTKKRARPNGHVRWGGYIILLDWPFKLETSK